MKELSTFLQEDGTKRYSVQVPDFIADRESFDHYEKDRFLSMELNLKKGDILFDVGSELGWQSAIYAKFVGAENMCLFEPAAELWPTIKQVWEANNLEVPLMTSRVLVSNKTGGVGLVNRRCWPSEAQKEPLESYDNWAAIHSFVVSGELPEVRLDDFVKFNAMPTPQAITMDVEGAEGRVLEGAWDVLLNQRPLVWVSIHPEERLKKYDTSREEILQFMLDAGYKNQYLGVDHESHYFFYPMERDVVLVNSPWMTHGTRHETFEQKIPDWKDPWQVERAPW